MFGVILFATMAFLPGGLIELGRRLRSCCGDRLRGGDKRKAACGA